MNRPIGRSPGHLLPFRRIPAGGEYRSHARWNMDRCRFRIAGALLLVMATALPAQGQGPMSPRAVGMSGALVGTARGVDALALNPACDRQFELV